MARLLQSYALRCPYQKARSYLEDSLLALATLGQPQSLRLHISISIDGKKTGIDKDVIVTFGEGQDPLHFDQSWTVCWTPSSGEAYPDFSGTLTVRAVEHLHSSLLELQGEYVPRSCTSGAPYDALVASRVASATAREFLRRLGRHIELRYINDSAGAFDPSAKP